MHRFVYSAFAALAAAAFAPPLAAQAQTKITIGIPTSPPNIVHMPVIVAKELGLYKKAGLDVDIVSLGDGVKVFRALLAGNIDLGLTPGAPTIIGRANGATVKALSANLPKFEASMVVRGDIKTMADLKGKRIGVNNLQSTTLNYVMRGIAKGGLGKDDVVFVEMPFNQFIPALEKKAVDAVMVYPPLVQTIEGKMKLAFSMPESDLHRTSANDATNIMMFSPGFAKTDAAKRFMVAHLKAQREYMRLVQSGQPGEICRVVNKYSPAMPADCAGVSFTGVDANGAINVESLERYQKEWMDWGVMKEPADIRKSVNLEFVRNAVTVLGPAR